MQYLLPCGACGRKHAVEPRQAGQKIACDCGTALEVPSLRGLRELERTEPAKVHRAGRTWTPARGVAFVVGILVALAGALVAGYALMVWTTLDTSEPPPENLTAEYAAIDGRTPEQTLTLWQNEIVGRGIGDYRVPRHVMARAVVQAYGWIAIVGIGLSVLGAVAITSSILSRRPARAGRG